MSNRPPSNTAEHVRLLARRYHIDYSETATDRLAHHMSRLAGDAVELDEIELLLIGLQRAGHLSRPEMILLQAQYLRENLPEHFAATKGLDGVALGTDTIQGRNDDPAVQAQYEQQRIKRAGRPRGR